MAEVFYLIKDKTEDRYVGREVTFVDGKEATFRDEFIGDQGADTRRRGNELAAV